MHLPGNFADVVDLKDFPPVFPRIAAAIGLGGIEQIHALVQGVIEEIAASGLVDFAAEGGGPEGEAGHTVGGASKG